MHKDHKITFVMLWHISERGGGAEVQANYLAQELAERGYNVSGRLHCYLFGNAIGT